MNCKLLEEVSIPHIFMFAIGINATKAEEPVIIYLISKKRIEELITSVVTLLHQVRFEKPYALLFLHEGEFIRRTDQIQVLLEIYKRAVSYQINRLELWLTKAEFIQLEFHIPARIVDKLQDGNTIPVFRHLFPGTNTIMNYYFVD